VLSFLGAVTALPTENVEVLESGAENSTVEARAIGGIYLCTDINYKGRCGYKVQPLYTCITLGSVYNKQISSFGPDSDFYYNLYE
jgi:hypothetical protein